MRDAERSRDRILGALAELLAEAGFREAGVNAVARRAGVDKVLIYRYFGGMEGLLSAFVAQGDFWPTLEDLLGEAEGAAPDGAAMSAALLRANLRELRRRPLTQEILRWELLERNALTDELAALREEQGLELWRRLGLEGVEVPGVDVAAAAAILHAGLTYLVLRAKTADRYLGVALDDEAGWSRIAAAIEPMVRTIMEGSGGAGPGEAI
jgi:AcrR family transcriptional regulator